MFSGNRLSSFQFDNQAIIDPQIGIVLAHHMPFVLDSDRLLLAYFNAQLFNLDAKSVLVHLFEKTGT